jgi:putative transposase
MLNSNHRSKLLPVDGRNHRSSPLPVDGRINKDFDPFALEWSDRRKATRTFSSAVKNKMYPLLGNLFPTADYSKFKSDSLLDVLFHNAMTNDTSENGTLCFDEQHKKNHPSPRTIRYRLERLDMDALSHVLQEGICTTVSVLKQQRLLVHPVVVSIDITHVPFYGRHKKFTCGTHGLKGTNYGYAYASVVVSTGGIRLTLHTIYMNQFTRKRQILKELIQEARKYVNIKTVLVDRGFFSVECIETLQKLQVNFLMPVVKYQKSFLQSLYPPCAAPMHMKSRNKEVSFTCIAVRDRDDPKTILYYATNMNIKEECLEEVIYLYKKRWSVENAFKSQKLSFLGKTYAVDYVIRFFFWMLATLLYNMWVLCNVTAFTGCNLKPALQIRPMITARLFGTVLRNTFVSDG